MLNSTKFNFLPTDYAISDIQPRGMHKHIAINQNRVNAYACFAVASFCAAADVYPLEPKDIPTVQAALKDMWSKLVADGKFIPNQGGFFSDGVDYARRSWNLFFPDRQVASFRCATGGDQWKEAVRLNWLPTLGMTLDDELMQDKQDGVMNGDTLTGGTWGHLVRYGSAEATLTSTNDLLLVLDNYPGIPNYTNEYQLLDFDTKKKNGIIYEWSYLFMKKQLTGAS